MARPELGLKRQCMSCGAKFYDLDKDPATCPKCGTIYQAIASTSRVAAPALAARAAAVPADDDEDTDAEKGGPEIVSLDEVEAAEDEADTSTDDSESDTADADDTFLEEEDAGDDDVADLIDGDIENDEES
ncbi:MAG: TIGR02300 family protein [Methylobacterium sp.]|uniref:TIGR02300 family protein n=1 Tax=unclassified Methylobacterium TaxID=2615210 RepID=UPI0009E983C3|nr:MULTISPECIES: TIGR02300 family protein [unclassified Methylobacterium]MDO9428090.1 TIGR02300 family protein [Methylobacterium sp.]TXM76479.1 TIGR02300 family protein [Methylobacterium sp. WL69]